MTRRDALLALLGVMVLGVVAVLIWQVTPLSSTNIAPQFDGQQALQDAIYQTSLGPRTPGSEAHAQVIEWLQTELKAAGWETQVQSTERLGHPIENVIALRSEADPQIILAAHYDSRLYADHDPDPAKRTQPVPGADDGASGVAVLLGLARSLPRDSVPVWLVFLDTEDDGDIPGWDWILGSRAFVEEMTVHPQAAVILDMVGDTNLTVYKEQNSDPALIDEIWSQAAKLGYSQVFIPTIKYRILDDHVPFLEAGIPAVDIIDIDYPYWHTTADTSDKLSANSLRIVGVTLLAWVNGYNH
jgi:glutaminyl-peptide cyclotransferase